MRRRSSSRWRLEGRDDLRVLISIGSRLGRDTSVYAMAMGVTLPFALVSVIAFTRLLNPGEYGDLAILMVLSGMLTTLYNLGTLQGSMTLVYGGAEFDEGGESDAHRGRATVVDKRRALTTAMAVTVAVVTIATVPLLLAAPGLAQWLLGDRALAGALRWAAIAAGAGSLFKLTVNVFRMEGRAMTYAVLNGLRPFAALAIGIPLVASGAGVAGATAGIAAGTILTVAAAVLAGRALYAWGIVADAARQLLAKGWVTVPVVAGYWTLQNADTLLLSAFQPDDVVGQYRVANRIAAFMLYLVSAFLMAAGPLERTPLMKAAVDRSTRAGVRSKLVVYYLIAGIYALLLLVLAADVLVLIAGSDLRRSAELIPIIASGFVLFGLYVLLTRIAVIPRRAFVRGWLAAGCAALFVVLGTGLVIALEGLGAALTMPLVMAMGCLVWVILVRRSTEPVDLQLGRAAAAAAIAAAGYGLTVLAGPAIGQWRTLLDVLVALAYPVLLVATGIVPRGLVVPLWTVASSVAKGGRPSRGFRRRVRSLSSPERSALRAAVRGAGASGHDETEFVHALRVLGGIDGERDHDRLIGVHLRDRGPAADRHARARTLWESGVDPWEVHELEELWALVNRMPARVWRDGEGGDRAADDEGHRKSPH